MNELCEFCPRRFDPDAPGKPGACRSSGDPAAPIIVVGMAPGKNELGSEPFVGDAGSLLWGAGSAAGLFRPDCFVMNVSNCWPLSGKKGKDLSEPQIGACWQRFEDELAQSKAKVMLLLGGDALRRVLGLRGIARYRGFVFERSHATLQTVSLPAHSEYKTSRKCPECKGSGSIPNGTDEMACGACAASGWKYRKGDKRLIREKHDLLAKLPPSVEYVVATYHPSFVMRMKRKPLRAFLNDIHRAVRATRDELEFREYKYFEVPVCSSDRGPIAFDIENIGGLEGAIDRMGMADASGVWTAPWNAQTREISQQILGDPSRLKIGHNAVMHDLKHLEAEGVRVEGEIFDTMWGGMVLEPDLPMGLRSMAPLWLDLRGCWKDENHARPEYYNAYDNGIDFDLGMALIARHKELGSYATVMRWIMPSLRVLLDMHRTGMQVDLAWLGDWSRRLGRRAQIVGQVWGREYPDVDLGSHDQLKQLLYGRLGMKPVKDPDNEFKPTTAAWAINLLIGRYPEYRNLLRTVLSFRKIEKLLTSTAVSLGPDGAVHPHFGPNWKDEQDEQSKRKGTTSTLRLAVAAASGLNMQQIPKYARRMYVAPPGMVFLEADLDRAEPWIYAVRSGDQALIHELEHGDPYLKVASAASCTRDIGKALFLARMYGAKEKKGVMILAKRGIDSDLRSVERTFEAMAKIYSQCESYRESIGQRAVDEGRLTSGFGIVRNFHGGSRDIPEAMDWEAQHHVALLLFTLLVPLHKMAQSFGGWLALTVYDSMTLCVPQEHAQAAARAMLDIIHTTRPEIAPGFKPRCSEVKIGRNWRDMRPLALA